MNASVHNPQHQDNFVSTRGNGQVFAVQWLAEKSSGSILSAFFDEPEELEALAQALLDLANKLREAKK